MWAIEHFSNKMYEYVESDAALLERLLQHQLTVHGIEQQLPPPDAAPTKGEAASGEFGTMAPLHEGILGAGGAKEGGVADDIHSWSGSRSSAGALSRSSSSSNPVPLGGEPSSSSSSPRAPPVAMARAPPTRRGGPPALVGERQPRQEVVVTQPPPVPRSDDGIADTEVSEVLSRISFDGAVKGIQHVWRDTLAHRWCRRNSRKRYSRKRHSRKRHSRGRRRSLRRAEAAAHLPRPLAARPPPWESPPQL